MDTPQPRWQRRKDARPAEIIEAALTLFIDRGFAATRLDDVAKQAGVTKGTVYLYFANKEDLFKAVIRETLVPELEMAESMIGEHKGPWADLLREMLLAWANRLMNSQTGGITKLMIAEASNFPELAQFYVNEIVVRSRRIFADIIERGIAAGEFRPVDVMMATRAVTAPLLMVKVWSRSFSACDPDAVSVADYAAFHFDMLMQGLKA
ncbi:MAG: TetR/AcrR family transcriptional regulator [Burkholderiales bacterium]|nr:TetR/AcrR family transcriptional regulator [Burkholderiales bacterium]